MDGVLIDSEHLWRKAEMEVFESYGVSLTDEYCKALMGIRTEEVVKYILADFKLDYPSDELSKQIVDTVCHYIQKEGVLIDGFCDLARALHQKRIPLAVATSSPMQVVDTVLGKAKLTGVFAIVVSAEKFPYGKPHPQVYIEACKGLGIEPVDCLAIEDSLNGTLAAKAARMQVIAIPDIGLRGQKGFGIADYVIEQPQEAQGILDTLC